MPSASAVSSPSSSASPTAPSPSSAAFHVGQPAPPLVLNQLGGGKIDLANLRGHPVWIDFMATWCAPCRDQLAVMTKYAARYAGNGLVVVAIDVREDEGTVAAFATQLAGAFPVGLDANGAAARTWAISGLPTHFFVDATGIVRDGAQGDIGSDVMVRGLGTIMPGVRVAPIAP
jgi:cytochrome c biogenesis protein CcmG/thiol:disulfide interchange protein DsbE